MLTSFLIVIIPVVFVAVANSYVKERTDISELMKIVLVVGPALVFINIVIGIYIYKAIKDPENYKVDPPIKLKPKKE